MSNDGEIVRISQKKIYEGELLAEPEYLTVPIKGKTSLNVSNELLDFNIIEPKSEIKKEIVSVTGINTWDYLNGFDQSKIRFFTDLKTSHALRKINFFDHDYFEWAHAIHFRSEQGLICTLAGFSGEDDLTAIIDLEVTTKTRLRDISVIKTPHGMQYHDGSMYIRDGLEIFELNEKGLSKIIEMHYQPKGPDTENFFLSDWIYAYERWPFGITDNSILIDTEMDELRLFDRTSGDEIKVIKEKNKSYSAPVSFKNLFMYVAYGQNLEYDTLRILNDDGDLLQEIQTPFKTGGTSVSIISANDSLVALTGSMGGIRYLQSDSVFNMPILSKSGFLLVNYNNENMTFCSYLKETKKPCWLAMDNGNNLYLQTGSLRPEENCITKVAINPISQ